MYFQRQSPFIYAALYLITILVTAAPGPGGAGTADCTGSQPTPIIPRAAVTLDFDGHRKAGLAEFEAQMSDPRHPQGYIHVQRLGFSKTAIKYGTPEGQAAYVAKELKTSPIQNIARIHGQNEAVAFVLQSLPTEVGSLEIQSLSESGSESYLDSTLSPSGELAFSLIVEQAGERGPISGKELFDQMMSFYGSTIQSIKGIWLFGTNLQMFKTRVRVEIDNLRRTEHRTPTETELQEIRKTAALGTWTGQQAQRYGFSNVSSVVVDDGGEVIVIFSK